MNSVQQINALAGNIDLYLLDQLLKGRFKGRKKLLDAGCGEGRNLHVFVKEKVEVHGIDLEPLAIKMCRMQFREANPDNFITGDLASLPYKDQTFDAIIVSAVLHFARSRDHFTAMWDELTRVACPGGMLFLRMASTWGLTNPEPREFSFLIDDTILEEIILKDWHLLEPVKSVWVKNERSMSVLVLERR